MPRILKHRIFIAIQIPEELKNNIEKILKKLNFSPPTRFVKKENWHITVSFLGYLSLEEIEILKNIIKEETTALYSFILRPEKIIWGPHGPIKRMIWLDFKQSREFEKLKNDIENKILSWQNRKSEAGFRYFQNFRKELRETNIHLTLARFEPQIFQNIKNLIPTQGINVNPVRNTPYKHREKNLSQKSINCEVSNGARCRPFKAGYVNIIESNLSKTGAEYKTLFSFNF